MPGMNSGLNVNDPTVVAAFRSALVHQALIALLIFAVLGVAWACLRAWRPAGTMPTAPPAGPEPAGRQLLVIGFGNLWLFDGILQAQPKMAIGLPSLVIEPTAASSPAWVQHVVNWAGTTWSYHPVQAGAAAVWIQIGIGIWMVAAPRGASSRLAGLAGAGWALVVWVFGESLGGILAPGLTWLTGAPGAAAGYLVAGLLIALPESAWRSPRLGRAMLGGLGLFLAGMAVLQAWPGRGLWQGISHGQPGALAAMAQSMSLTPQPGFLSGWLFAFGTFDEAHGFAVNLVVVVALAAVGAAFLSGRPRLIRLALPGFLLLCLASWVLVQDLGFLGGLGTDPNSMIPFALLAGSGYLAFTRWPALAAGAAPAAAAPALAGPPASAAAPVPAAPLAAAGAQAVAGAPWYSRFRPAALHRYAAGAGSRSVAALGGAALIVLGAAPMAVAQASSNADPILAESLAGPAAPLDYPAAGFALTDQNGATVTLASLRGKVVLLSFFDPACTSACPPIGQEFRRAAVLLGASARDVALVGIVLSPGYRPVSTVRAFDRRENLSRVPGWLCLTGSLARLRQVWRGYGITAQDLAGAAAQHTAEAFVIDRAGRVRRRFSTEPGPGTAAIRSSFAVLFATAARQAMAPPGR
jgi:cytochrome oxidase Cu insertion factor (SCO1/SenC/PrrC family)